MSNTYPRRVAAYPVDVFTLSEVQRRIQAGNAGYSLDKDETPAFRARNRELFYTINGLPFVRDTMVVVRSGALAAHALLRHGLEDSTSQSPVAPPTRRLPEVSRTAVDAFAAQLPDGLKDSSLAEILDTCMPDFGAHIDGGIFHSIQTTSNWHSLPEAYLLGGGLVAATLEHHARLSAQQAPPQAA